MMHTRGSGQWFFVSNYCSKVWVYAPNFRKSALSKRFCDFGRPCRGLSPGKGFAPQRRYPIWLVELFYALRVLPAQGEFRSKSDVKKTGERYDFRQVFRRFLAIHKFVLNGASKMNYFRSRRVRWSIREVQVITFSGRILRKRNSNLITKNDS